MPGRDSLRPRPAKIKQPCVGSSGRQVASGSLRRVAPLLPVCRRSSAQPLVVGTVGRLQFTWMLDPRGDEPAMIETTYPHIAKPTGEPACLIRLPRVRVAQVVMDYLAYGWSADEMVRQHPCLHPAEVHAAMAYYFDHAAEIDEEIRREWSEVEQSRATRLPSPVVLRLLAARKP